MSRTLHPATIRNKNNPKLHSTYIEKGSTEEISVYSDPHYGKQCVVCGKSPCVQIRRMDNDEIIFASGMCGPCTFGEAACLDPEEW